MTSFLFYLSAFALILGVLVIVHEYGHYLAARSLGVKVLRFSVGFGKPLLSRKIGRDGTEWSLGVFPLGGYVKMLDEREGMVPQEEQGRSFNRQSVWRRMLIVVAGPMANLLLAVFLYWGLFWYGTEEPKPLLGTPPQASAAAKAGFENGEEVLKVAGNAVRTWQEMRWVLLQEAVNQDSIELELINLRQEINVRRIDVSLVRNGGGWEGDVLDKLGIRLFRPKLPPVIGTVGKASPAEFADIRPGDRIQKVNGVEVSSWFEFVQEVRGSPGVHLKLSLERDGNSIDLEVLPESIADDGRTVGRIGASVRDVGPMRSELMTVVRYGAVPALGKALEETYDQSIFSLVMIGKMIVGEVSWRNISGPVTIADYAGQSARLGLGYYLKFLALVSISLAVLNLLPIPILDGGHLLYYVLEIIKRGPLSERSTEVGQQIGLALMLMLMACAFYNDINRLISG